MGRGARHPRDPYYQVLIELFDRIPSTVAEHDLSVRFIGSLDLLPASLVEAAKRLEEQCATGRRRLTIALAYGGRQEIVDAARDSDERRGSTIGIPPLAGGVCGVLLRRRVLAGVPAGRLPSRHA